MCNTLFQFPFFLPLIINGDDDDDDDDDDNDSR